MTIIGSAPNGVPGIPARVTRSKLRLTEIFLDFTRHATYTFVQYTSNYEWGIENEDFCLLTFTLLLINSN